MHTAPHTGQSVCLQHGSHHEPFTSVTFGNHLSATTILRLAITECILRILLGRLVVLLQPNVCFVCGKAQGGLTMPK
jgi:hypothetical protein